MIGEGEIILNDLSWNCQNWVVERLHDLRASQGVGDAWNIKDVDQVWLLEELRKSQRV